MLLKIIKNGKCEKELNLAPGIYLIGRKEDCDIHLDGKKISRHHAKLKVEEKYVQIEDTKSSNGVEVNGEKIQKKKIELDQTIKIGDYELKLYFDRQQQIITQKNDFLPKILLYGGNHPYHISIVLLGLFFLVIAGVGITVTRNYSQAIFTQQEINRAILISKSIRDINAQAWQNNETTKFSLSDFSEMEGVTHILLVDQFGRVQAPLDQFNSTINYPIFQKTLQSGKLNIETQKENEYMICCPAVFSGIVKGAVILSFNIRNPEAITVYNWFLSWGILVLLAVLQVALSIFLVKLFLHPWKLFLVSAHKAISGMNKNIAFASAGYKELEEAKLLFERLLLLRSFNNASPEPTASQKDNNETMPKKENNDGNNYENLSKSYENFIILEETNNTIIYCNPGISKLLGLENNKQGHILDILYNVDQTIYETIIKILQDDQTDSIVSIEGTQFFVHKKTNVENPSHILIVFDKS
jgi:hypothetical protein